MSYDKPINGEAEVRQYAMALAYSAIDQAIEQGGNLWEILSEAVSSSREVIITARATQICLHSPCGINAALSDASEDCETVTINAAAYSVLYSLATEYVVEQSPRLIHHGINY